jgi:outer membrane protein
LFKRLFLFCVASVVILLPMQIKAQKVAFIASDIIREKFTEAQQASQRIKSIVDEWKRELEDLDKQIQDLEFEIKKNRLIWSDEEKTKKNQELESLKTQKLDFARKKFEAGGEYDLTVKTIMKPIEEKIYAAVQEVSSDEGYDIVIDKSVNPLAYTNFKYDLTVKVLRKLGVDVKKLQDELEEKIKKDPRNQKPETKGPPRGRSRDQKSIEKDNQNQNNQNTTTPTTPTTPDSKNQPTTPTTEETPPK